MIAICMSVKVSLTSLDDDTVTTRLIIGERTRVQESKEDMRPGHPRNIPNIPCIDGRRLSVVGNPCIMMMIYRIFKDGIQLIKYHL